jgi:hypothetical protein
MRVTMDQKCDFLRSHKADYKIALGTNIYRNIRLEADKKYYFIRLFEDWLGTPVSS